MTRSRRRKFDTDFKLRVLSDYYQSGMPKNYVSGKWGIATSLLRTWLRLWPVDSKELSLPAEIISTYRMSGKGRDKSDEQILQERISALERSLQIERMRSRALEKVIEIAEREEGISILKKDGVKQ